MHGIWVLGFMWFSILSYMQFLKESIKSEDRITMLLFKYSESNLSQSLFSKFYSNSANKLERVLYS